MELQKVMSRELEVKSLKEMADAHCHLDMVDLQAIEEAKRYGVRTMITNGVDTKSNHRALELANGFSIFACLGVDPEHAIGMPEAELDANIELIRKNKDRIVGIGEIGLDRGGRIGDYERQKSIFERFLSLSLELGLPVSIHSRNALDDVLEILERKEIKRAHIHFFEGNIQHAKRIERLGYMVSIPPVDTEKRKKVIREISIDNIMVESDSPAASPSPKGVEMALGLVADAEGHKPGKSG